MDKPFSKKSDFGFAKKSFGQNFLIDDSVIEEIVAAVAPQPDETIIEIGAGRGALTRRLLESGANIIAIEFDRDLIPFLKVELKNYPNLSLVEADVLKIDFSQLLSGKKAKLVANLPYYISTATLQKILEQRRSFTEAVLMLQREVVDRITAPAGGSERSFLSVLVQAYADVETLFDVSPGAFRPIPKVWSSVIKVELEKTSLITSLSLDELKFRKLISAGFAQKRKTIFNNLKNFSGNDNESPNLMSLPEILKSAQIEPQRRAETLTLEEWCRLAEFYNQKLT